MSPVLANSANRPVDRKTSGASADSTFILGGVFACSGRENILILARLIRGKPQSARYDLCDPTLPNATERTSLV